MNDTFECVLDIKAHTGECPVWSVEEQCLFWIDVHKDTFNRFDPATRNNRAWPLPGPPGSFVLTDDGSIILAMNDGFYDFDQNTGLLNKMAEAPYDQAKVRFSDGRTDRQGRFVVGTVLYDVMNEEDRTLRAFYSYDGDVVTQRIAPIDLANGTAFSPDGRTMYRSEWRNRAIFAYDYDPLNGNVSNERIFATLPADLGAGDGAAVDTEGGYWSALPAGPGGGLVVRLTPDGTIDQLIDFPVWIPTMPAFGGPNMSTLYVTSASIEPMLGRETGRYSGGLFAIETKFQGIPETPFRKLPVRP